MFISLSLPKNLATSTQLLIVLVGTLLFGDLLPTTVQATFYSISLTLKALLLFVLPFIVFSYLFSSILIVSGIKALRFILFLVVLVCISNYISTLVAYGVASLKLVNIAVSSINLSHNNELVPLWNIKFPEWLSSSDGLYFGYGLGFLLSFFPSVLGNQFSVRSKQYIDIFLEKGFVPLLPLFVLGFILKMQFDGILIQSIKHSLPLMLLIILTYIIYITLLFAIVAGFNFSLWQKYIKNVIPAALTGFSTMSSLVAMPLTISAAEQNTNDSEISRLVIPATVNIHMIGLAINIPLMALSILLSFGHELPTFAVYNKFACYFILMQFAAAAAPGCGILLMIPLLETYLGFTGEMSALITTLYIIFDPAETSANVLGNSILVITLSKICKGWKKNLVKI